jgi:hypothetical protein
VNGLPSDYRVARWLPQPIDAAFGRPTRCEWPTPIRSARRRRCSPFFLAAGNGVSALSAAASNAAPKPLANRWRRRGSIAAAGVKPFWRVVLSRAVTSARFAFVSWQMPIMNHECNSRLKRGMAEDFRESGRRHRAASRCTRTSTPRPSSGTTRDAERLGARGGVGLCNPGHRGAGPRLFAVRANFVSHRALIPELSRALTVFLTQPSAL